MNRTSDVNRPGWTPSTWIMLSLTVAVGALVAATGGRSSEYLSFLFLPVLLAVIRFPWRPIFLAGLAVTAIYLLLPSGNAAGPLFEYRDAVRVVLLNGMTALGALYARQVQGERERLRVTVEEKDALLNVSQVVTSCDKLEYALDSALLMLRTVLPNVRCAAIYLADEGKNILIREAQIGAGTLPDRIRPDDLPSNWSLESADPYSAGPGATIGAFSSGTNEERHRGAALMGLRCVNAVVGLLYVEVADSAGQDGVDLRLVKGFAERIGFPLHKIRMQEGLHSLAFTDQMTGLHNYRAFRAQLEDEWRRAVRYRRPLSLILIDLDHFKQINDRYGHPAGDKLLEGIAKILRDTVRETDVPARYGGEEFVVVCPETSEEDVHVVAERVRSAIEASRFRLSADESTAITCSVGIATYPAHASTEDALVDAADAALYCAKRNGKNTVRSADSLPFLASETGT